MDLLIQRRISLLFLLPLNGLLVTLLPSDITGWLPFVLVFFPPPHVFNAVIGDFLPIPALAFLKSTALNIADINFIYF
jgi:hypothetical protein